MIIKKTTFYIIGIILILLCSSYLIYWVGWVDKWCFTEHRVMSYGNIDNETCFVRFSDFMRFAKRRKEEIAQEWYTMHGDTSPKYYNTSDLVFNLSLPSDLDSSSE